MTSFLGVGGEINMQKKKYPLQKTAKLKININNKNKKQKI